jgi:hypothetical protein
MAVQMSPTDPAWQSADPASLEGATADVLDQLFLELFRRTVGGTLTFTTISTLENAGIERVVTRRYGPAHAGLLRTERSALDAPSVGASIAWDVHGVAGIEVRARYQPGRDGRPATVRMPVQLGDAHAGEVFAAAWRHAFGTPPHLVELRTPERLKMKGPPFRCTNCGDTLGAEPEDTRTCPRCLSPLEPARAIAKSQWGPLTAELHAPGLHRLFSSFERAVDVDVGADVVFDACPEGSPVPPCAGIAIGPMGAGRTVLLRPDGTFALACDRVVEGSEPGTYPRERVMAIDWTEHPSLGRGVGERNRLRVTVDHLGIRARIGEHLLFGHPPSADDTDAKCVCLVAGCDVHGTSVRFERFERSEASDDAPSSDDPTRVARRSGPHE